MIPSHFVFKVLSLPSKNIYSRYGILKLDRVKTRNKPLRNIKSVITLLCLAMRGAVSRHILNNRLAGLSQCLHKLLDFNRVQSIWMKT
jgi:hypothetical protein